VSSLCALRVDAEQMCADLYLPLDAAPRKKCGILPQRGTLTSLSQQHEK
jgi:hypothetical protein